MAVVGKGSEKSGWEMPDLSVHFRPLVLLRSEVTAFVEASQVTHENYQILLIELHKVI